MKILLAVDGSEYSVAAVEEAARIPWPEGSVVRIVSVAEIFTLTSEVIIGHTEEEIIETAKAWDADLIVLGSHGFSGFKRFLLGSVSQAVVSHAPCSVEIARKHALG